ncbi:unnamed protein product [Paramecium primaurelia]|uniref:Ubiquitinyl hydrolase 1 n=1 Tax=Paramecium primaurelia TaxID=5886 RepID=A0A8S1N4C1_PARPR|nr:unnamed protein product [Paramecium primaurelia]
MQSLKDTDNNSENLNEEDNSINQQVPQFPQKKAPSYSNEVPQILKLQNSFRNAQGNTRRELECQLIKRLVDLKKNSDSDWYRLNGVWAQKYTTYLYDNSSTLPGPIDNTDLLQQKNLVRNVDFYVVNETVWKFLLEEYSGGPEILDEKIPRSPSSNASSTTDRAKSVEISIVSYVPKLDKNPEIPIKGLKNELYYCYMHSCLQCMMCIKELNNLILNSINTQHIQDMTFCTNYQEFLRQLKDTQNDYIKINSLRNNISKKFNPKHQHDAQEFLLFLLSNLEDEINNFNKKDRQQQTKLLNVIDKYLKGQIVSEIICKNCYKKSQIMEDFITLSLALMKINTINQSLDEFLNDELIQDYKCDNCYQKKTAIKKTKITKLPQYLIIHLKRFKFFPKYNKIIQHVKFSFESTFYGINYSLVGIIVHSGSLEQGHYYSYCKRQNKWWLFNDQKTKQVNNNDVLQQQAYILFYQQLL